MFNQDNDKSVFVWGHYGKKLEMLDKDRFKLLAEANPHIALSRLYNQKVGEISRHIEEIKQLDIEENLKAEFVKTELELIREQNDLDNIFREANKLMIGLGDSVSFGSLVTGQLERSTKHGKIVKPKEKVIIE